MSLNFTHWFFLSQSQPKHQVSVLQYSCSQHLNTKHLIFDTGEMNQFKVLYTNKPINLNFIPNAEHLYHWLLNIEESIEKT